MSRLAASTPSTHGPVPHVMFRKFGWTYFYTHNVKLSVYVYAAIHKTNSYILPLAGMPFRGYYPIHG